MLGTQDGHHHSERLSDESDMASLAEARATNVALETQREKMRQALSVDFDGIHCVECDEKINSGRIDILKYRVAQLSNKNIHDTDKLDKKSGMVIKHGTDLCVACKTVKDIHRKQTNH